MAKKDASGKDKAPEKSEEDLRKEGREVWGHLTKKERQKLSEKEIAEIRGIPFHKYINCGNAPIIIPKRPDGAARGPGRFEPGDFAEGEYYEQVMKEGKPMGFMRMCLVDDKRLDELAHKKAIRDGEELEDWQKEAKAKLIEDDGEVAPPAGHPVENLRTAMAQKMPHSSDKK